MFTSPSGWQMLQCVLLFLKVKITYKNDSNEMYSFYKIFINKRGG